MSHNWCPGNRRGHTWREPEVKLAAVLSAGIDPRAARICKRCGQLGCVTAQGLIRPVSQGARDGT